MNTKDRILLDVLKFIELNEVEKSQFVCKRWNDVIIFSKEQINQRRRIRRLTISQDYRIEYFEHFTVAKFLKQYQTS